MIDDLLSIFREPCTGWPNYWGRYMWAHCCSRHDYNYSQALELSKWQADEYLWYCVRESTGLVWLADLMFWGLWLFGWPAWLNHRVNRALDPRIL
jgi:hypothetical protein